MFLPSHSVLRRFGFGFLACVGLPWLAAAKPEVRLNSVGFTEQAPKVATVAGADAVESFEVVRASDGVVVWKGRLTPAFAVAAHDTDETVRLADFSAWTEPGRFRLRVGGEASGVFGIGSGVWDEPFLAVMRGFYLWRCGVEVTGEWHGQHFHQAPCHLEDGWLDHVGGGHVRRPSTGGWHDAGDYNKYIVNAAYSIGMLLGAWDHFGPAITAKNLGIPESGNATPDLLDEVRWELDWFFTMQESDGRVFHKLSAETFRYWGPAAGDRDPRYFAPWGTAATADFAAVMALASRQLRPYDLAYAERCLAAARLAWSCLEKHPEEVKPDQSAFHTGAYGSSDRSPRLWAAAELWAATGEAVFLESFERQATAFHVSEFGPGWGDVQDFAIGTYLETASPARDAALVRRFEREVKASAARISSLVTTHAYGRAMGGAPGSWYWGANGQIAASAYLLTLADRIEGTRARRATIEASLAFLFGRNFHGRSYVTGVGVNPPQHPHDRRGEPAWPGYLVGGGWPTGRSWKDDAADYRQNEIALNWNATLAYAIAACLPDPKAP